MRNGRPPVPGTGQNKFRQKRRKLKKARTGSMGSKVLPHQYGDEGEKGPQFRRQVRRAEERLWRSEVDRT